MAPEYGVDGAALYVIAPGFIPMNCASVATVPMFAMPGTASGHIIDNLTMQASNMKQFQPHKRLVGSDGVRRCGGIDCVKHITIAR